MQGDSFNANRHKHKVDRHKQSVSVHNTWGVADVSCDPASSVPPAQEYHQREAPRIVHCPGQRESGANWYNSACHSTLY